MEGYDIRIQKEQQKLVKMPSQEEFKQLVSTMFLTGKENAAVTIINVELYYNADLNALEPVIYYDYIIDDAPDEILGTGISGTNWEKVKE